MFCSSARDLERAHIAGSGPRVQNGRGRGAQPRGTGKKKDGEEPRPGSARKTEYERNERKRCRKKKQRAAGGSATSETYFLRVVQKRLVLPLQVPF